MRNLFCCCAKTDHQVAAKSACHLYNTLSEDVPRHMWFNSIHHHHVARTLRVANNHELIFWPPHLTLTIFVKKDFGALLSEIKERVGVNVGYDGRVAFFQHPVKRRRCNSANVEKPAKCNQHDGVA